MEVTVVGLLVGMTTPISGIGKKVFGGDSLEFLYSVSDFHVVVSGWLIQFDTDFSGW